jgi:hypothetical protein
MTRFEHKFVRAEVGGIMAGAVADLKAAEVIIGIE